jgi:hypothetical protein
MTFGFTSTASGSSGCARRCTNVSNECSFVLYNGISLVVEAQETIMPSTMRRARSDHAKYGYQHTRIYASALDGQSTIALTDGNCAI